MLPETATLPELQAECERIARIAGSQASWSIGFCPAYHAVTIRAETYKQDTFIAATWAEALQRAEAYARTFATVRDAGDIEYRSWCEPELALAAE